MIFGEVPLEEAEGAILAHSLRVDGAAFKKGRRIDAAMLATLAEKGVRSVIAARLEPGDAPEDEAASRVANALLPNPRGSSVVLSAPFTGRVNFYAAADGLFEIGSGLVHQLNAVDESVTLATLAAPTWVAARTLLGTVKIIPYAAPQDALAKIEALVSGAREDAPRVRPATRRSATLLLTKTPGFSGAALEKGAAAVRDRLAKLAAPIAEERIVTHRTDELAEALAAAKGDFILVLAASATSDRRDVAPAAIVKAGGRVERLGMPVDPGNLLALGRIAERPVIGLPGCARSPKLNGADWVLERVAAGLFPSSREIAEMGFGGLLKEIPMRPAPRGQGDPGAGARPKIAGLLLAAGGSSRMGEGRHKLLETIDGAPLVRRSAQTLLAAELDEVLAVLGADSDRIASALEGLELRRIENPVWSTGMASSLRAGALALGLDVDAALVMLADMPSVDAALIKRLVAAFSPEEGREIIRPLGRGGKPGHPILFGRRFFESLSGLSGDEGARRVLAEHPEFVVEIDIGGDGPLLDLDTPEDWSRYKGDAT